MIYRKGKVGLMKMDTKNNQPLACSLIPEAKHAIEALLKIRDGGFIIINLITPTTIEWGGGSDYFINLFGEYYGK